MKKPNIRIVLFSIFNLLFVFSNAQVSEISLSESGANNSLKPDHFCLHENSVYFTAKNSKDDYVLWEMTADNEIRQISLTEFGADRNPNPTFMTSHNGALYFSATDPKMNRKLWKMENGNFSIVPLTENGSNVNPAVHSLFSFNNELFFTAKNRNGSSSFWVINENNEIKEIGFEEFGASKSPNPKNFKEYNGKLFFNAQNNKGVNTLWNYDGETFSEISLPEETSGQNPNPNYLEVFNNKLFFNAVNHRGENVLWSVDENNSIENYSLFSVGGSFNYRPEYLCAANDFLYFKGIDNKNNRVLWQLSPEGVFQKISIKNQGGNENYWPSFLTKIGGDLYFRAQDNQDNWNLWYLSAHGKIKRILISSAGGSQNPTPNNFYAYNDKLFFAAKDKNENYKFWEFKNNFVTSVWNGTWSNGLPDKNTDVIIKGNYYLQDIEDLECLDLDITPDGQLTVPNNKTITVHGNLINKGLLKIENSEDTNSGSLVTKGEVANEDNGLMQSEIELTRKQNFLSSPVSHFRFSDNNASVYSFIENAVTKKEEWILENNFLWTKAKGYFVIPENETFMQFNGQFNNHDQDIDIIKNARGFNLVGNPYPSALNWNSPDWKDRGNVSNTLYSFSALSGNFSYCVFTEENYPGGRINGNTGIINPLEAFFVLAKSNAGDFKISNSARVHTKNENINKSETNSDINYCILQISDGQNSDETSVRFISESTPEFDVDYDAYKMFDFSGVKPQLFSTTQTNLHKLAINSQSEIYTGLIVPLAIRVKDGNYTIKANEFHLNTTNHKALLKDNKTGEMIDLSTESYEFYANETDNPNRFSLHFASVLAINDLNSSLPKIYSHKKRIYVNSQNNEEYNLELFSLNGSKVFSEQIYGNYSNEFPTLPTGTYIAKLKSDKKIKTIKLYFAE